MTKKQQEHNTCLVSIIIKTLNEEAKIATAIESALKAVECVGGEVILADSLSTDRTIEIAQQYPIKIIQLSNAKDRSCGIGPQLGYQMANGGFIYILDGDMQILDTFLPKAIKFMEQNIQAAGVGGKLVEMNTESLEFQARVKRNSTHMQAGTVDRLDGGALYRKTAIESVGYFSNRNLHSYEELDLAIRLRAQGWQLHRIDVDAVRHWGHDAPPYQLLKKRWQSGYINGLGELLRAALGKPHFKLILKDVKELRIYLAVILWWLCLIVLPFTDLAPLITISLWVGLLIMPLLVMTLKKRSLKKGFYSVVSWNLNSAGLLRGFFSSKTNLQNIASTYIKPSKET